MKNFQASFTFILYIVFSVFLLQSIGAQIKKPEKIHFRSYADNHPEAQALQKEKEFLIEKSYEEGLFQDEIAREEEINRLIETYIDESIRRYEVYQMKKSAYDTLMTSAILSIITIYGFFSYFCIRKW